MRPGVALAAVAMIFGCVVLLAGSQWPSAAVSPAISVSDASGPFALTLTADHGRYASGSPIDVTATVEYTGDAASIDVAHDSIGLAAFGIDEPVYGMNVNPVSDLTCAHTILAQGRPMPVAFTKTGSSLQPPPDPSAAAAFFSDPALRLPPGTWHIYAVTDLPLHACGGVGAEYHLRAQVQIEVVR